MKIYDISLPIKTGMVVYPKNPRVRVKPLKGKGSLLSEISMGTHTGTHIDAPKHVYRGGKPIDKMDLSAFIGPCRVLNMTRVRSGISVDDLKRERIKPGERILFKTKNSSRGYKRFRSDFIYLEGDAADVLVQRGVKLVGIDYLSIKKRGHNDHRPHTAFLKKNIPIVEGINLRDVRAGIYELVVFPLRISGGDGAPARAVLIK